jgi:L-ascorbate metabolism protein UlaG (beta-lactamase superfamily)
MNRRKALKYAATIPLSASLPTLLTTGQKAMPAAGQKANPGEMQIQRLAWAGIKVVIDNTTLFVDATSYTQEGDQPLQVDTENVHAAITHHHSDHYDPDSLKKIFSKRSQLICSEDVLPWVDTRDLRTHPLKTYQPVDVSRWTGDLVAIPVPAVDGFGHPQVSWVIRGGGKTIIHCGDTLWHGYWRDIAIAYGPFDIAFMPINAARMIQGKIIDTGIPAVMNPEQAVVAAGLLNAKRICAIHYGRSSDNYIETPDPEGNFKKACQQRKMEFILPKEREWIKF